MICSLLHRKRKEKKADQVSSQKVSQKANLRKKKERKKESYDLLLAASKEKIKENRPVVKSSVVTTG